MELFASPLACSLASHITALEAKLPLTITFVDTAAKKMPDGSDYRAITPKGYVPALRLPSGDILTENPAVLQWLADQNPSARLAPAWGSAERYKLMEWLNYLSTEVHKRVFSILLNPRAPQESRAAAQAQVGPLLDHVSKAIGDRQFLVGGNFTVADAYFITLLNWFRHIGTDLAGWPNIAAYAQTMWARPSVAQAMGVEIAERQKRAA